MPTQKFFAFREVIAKHRAGEQFPALPAEPAQIQIPEFTLSESSELWTNLGEGVDTRSPRPMESFGQSYGYILYRTRVDGPKSGQLSVHELRDYAQIHIDGKLVGELDRRMGQDHLDLDLSAGAHTLDILVENSGRINFGPKLREDRKGITESVSLGDSILVGWKVFCLPMSRPLPPKQN